MLGDEPLALFAAFGVFAMLSFADFGGPLLARARAYLVFAVVGAAIVVAGTLVSTNRVATAVVAVVVIFAIQLVSSFGGSWAAAAVPATLAFVLAAVIQAPPGQAVPQALGWLLAGVVSAVAAVALWPRRTRSALRALAAEVADRYAAALAAWLAGAPPAELAERIDALDAATIELSTRWEATKLRPSGPAERDQALTYLVDEVRQVRLLTPALRSLAAAQGPPDPADRAMVGAATAIATATAAVLRGEAASVDLDELAGQRRADLEEIEAEVGRDLAAGRGAEAVTRVARSYTTRLLAHTALSMAANARILAGGSVDPGRYQPPPVVPVVGDGGLWRRAARMLRAHASPRTPACRNAVRAALAITVAVVLAQAFEVEHGFWVALGTLSVLRSNVAGTATGAAEAVAGTAVGFAVTIPIFVLLGEATWPLWALLPLTTFLSAWTPTVIHFAAGQASFTLFVVVLFNLVEPAGWRTGLVRVQDIVLGVVVAVAVGLVVWPRGVGAQLADLAATALRRSAAYLEASCRATFGGGPEPRAAADEAAAALAEADEALVLARADGRVPGPALDRAHRVLVSGARLRHAGDGVGWIRAGLPPVTRCPAGTGAVVAAAAEVRAEAAAAADALVGLARAPGVAPPDPERALAGAEGEVGRWAAGLRGGPGQADDVISLAFGVRWLRTAALVASAAASLVAPPASSSGNRPDRASMAP